MKQILILLMTLMATLVASAQVTKINPVTLLKPGSNSTFLVTDGSGNVAWSNASSLLNAGAGITISGNTITNSSPDQTVALTGTGIVSVSGTYPNFNISATEIDGSTSNELQTLTRGGGANGTQVVNLSQSGGSVIFAPGNGISLTGTGSTLTITSTAAGKVFDFSAADYREVLTSAKTTIATTGITLAAADCIVFQDGVKREHGSGNDYTFSGSSVTFTYQLPIGTKIEIYKQQ